MGHSHCKDPEETCTSPWAAAVMLRGGLADDRTQTCLGAQKTTRRDTSFGRTPGSEVRMTALWVQFAELIESSEEVNDH